jgi:hypothetical protein
MLLDGQSYTLRNETAAQPAANRSRVKNGKMIAGVDDRLAEARLYRDLYQSSADDCGRSGQPHGGAKSACSPICDAHRSARKASGRDDPQRFRTRPHP